MTMARTTKVETIARCRGCGRRSIVAPNTAPNKRIVCRHCGSIDTLAGWLGHAEFARLQPRPKGQRGGGGVVLRFKPAVKTQTDKQMKHDTLTSKTADGNWLIKCRDCGHIGTVRGDAPTSARVKCTSCGFVAQIRQSVGPRPTPVRRQSGERAQREQAAKAVLERLGDQALDDPVADLWRAPE